MRRKTNFITLCSHQLIPRSRFLDAGRLSGHSLKSFLFFSLISLCFQVDQTKKSISNTLLNGDSFELASTRHVSLIFFVHFEMIEGENVKQISKDKDIRVQGSNTLPSKTDILCLQVGVNDQLPGNLDFFKF